MEQKVRDRVTRAWCAWNRRKEIGLRERGVHGTEGKR